MFYHIHPFTVGATALAPIVVSAENLVSQPVCDAVALAVITANANNFDIYVTADGDTTAPYGIGYYRIDPAVMTTVKTYVNNGIGMNVDSLVSAIIMFDMFASRTLSSL